MKYTLMHKNTPVVDIDIDKEIGYILKIGDIWNEKHLPVGLKISANKNGMSRKMLNDWWTGRSIPANRSGLKDNLGKLGVSSAAQLPDKSYGLSLSGQYWICPHNSDMEWSKINFFENEFSKDVGEILFGQKRSSRGKISLVSPDNTSDGWLKKKWIIAESKRYLVKGGSGVFEQEPFNEAIASALMERLNISHVEYSLIFEKNAPYSVCEDFITAETDLIPAWQIFKTQEKQSSMSDFDHFQICCEKAGIGGLRNFLDKMLTVDYIIANTDRHYGNFGAVRNAATLEWLGFAPIYDSGTSLWHNKLDISARNESRPFKKIHESQINLVKDFSWLDFDKLKDFDIEIMQIFSKSATVDSERAKKIAGAVLERARQIELRSRRVPSV